MVRGLRDTAAQAAKQVQTTTAALNASRAAFDSLRPTWETAVKNLLDAYFRPADHTAQSLPAAVDNVIATSDAMTSPRAK